MAASRSKKEQLSKTAKSYIQDIVLEHKYGIKKNLVHAIPTKGTNANKIL